MGWLDQFFGAGPPTFEQDLELLIGRWTDHSKRREWTMSIDQVAEALVLKAGQLKREQRR